MKTKLMQKLRETLKTEKELLKGQLKNNFWYFVIALFFVLGCTILFKPIFNKIDFLVIEKSEIMDVFVLGVSLFVIIRHITWAFKNYILSRLYEFFVLVISLVYLIYRLVFNDYWNFSCVTFNNEIFYFDFILGSLLLGILILKSKRFLNHLKIELEGTPNTALISFSSVEDDSFIRAKSASDFMDIILQCEDMQSEDKSAIAVGIVGPWGVGKSWYMKRMEDRVRQHYKSTHDVIELNPWKSPTGQDIIVEFLNVLKDKLAVNNGNFNRLIDSYVKSITKIDKTNSISTFISVMGNTEKEIDEFEKIQKELEKSNKKFVVFIDDIDRLGDAEVMEVLKLIRNTANFGRLYFVVGYDKAHLLKAISKTFKHKHEKFLDKIFQVEKELSIIPSYLLKNEFLNELIKFKESKFVSKDNSIDIENQTLNIMDGLKGIGHANYLATIFDMTIKNKRELYKLLNSFKLKVVYLKNERIDLVQLLILDILNLIDYKNYRALQNPSDSLIKTDDNLYIYVFDKTAPVLTKPDGISFEMWTLFKNNIEIGPKLMQILFTKGGKSDNYGKINNPQYFNSFFEFSGVLTLSIFITEFLEDKGVDIDSKIEQYTNNGQLNELVKIVKDEGLKIIPNDLDKFEQFIEIVNAISIKAKEGLLNKSYFEPTKLDELYKDKANKRWSFIKKISNRVGEFNKYLLWDVEIRDLKFSQNPLDEIKNCIFKFNQENSYNQKYGENVRIGLLEQVDTLNLKSKLIADSFVLDDVSKKYYINNIYQYFFKTYSGLADYVRKQQKSFEKQEFLTFYRRFEANDFRPIEFIRGTIEITSGEDTYFYGSQIYNKNIEWQRSVQFIHNDFQGKIEESHPVFRNVPWIAKDEVIDNKAEQYNGDIYTFKRSFDIIHLECLKSITLKLFVDDVLKEATINSEKIFGRDIITGSHDIALRVFENVSFLKKENEVTFKIKNFSFQEINQGQRSMESIEPGENPYGIIYILELQYDMEKLKAEKIIEI